MKITSAIIKYYDFLIIEKPYLSIIALLFITILFSIGIKNFKMDASADSLVLENDLALKHHRATSARYGAEDFVVITFKPKDGIYNQKTLNLIDVLSKDLKDNIPGISSVLSILDVPLLNSPKVSLSELSSKPRTLRSDNIDYDLVKKEFLTSPLYKDLLMSKDSTTTIIIINFLKDKKFFELLNQRNSLREISLSRDLTKQEIISLKKLEVDFKNYSTEHATKEKKIIKNIREVISKYKKSASMFLGGVPMITSDMTDFIEQDVLKFGIGVFIFLILILFIIFKSIRWVFIPLFICIISVIFVTGLFGFLDWRVTVISSNYAALLLIITMSMTIHLAVRYRELHAENIDRDKKNVIKEVVHYMFVPCVYTTLTTLVGFASLVVSCIRPVIDFGNMIIVGILVAFIITFILFPTILMVLSNDIIIKKSDLTKKITKKFAEFSIKHYSKIIVSCFVIFLFSMYGISKITVENRFIDYFKANTEIHQGMLEIDKKLGGTTPFDIVINKQAEKFEKIIDKNGDNSEFEDLSLLFGETEEDFKGYWLNKSKLKEIVKIHEFLEAQPEVGKVLSLATLYKLAIGLNNNQPLSDIQVGAIKSSLSEEVKKILLHPYLSDDESQTRLTLRVIDSNKKLNRKEFIQRVENFLSNEMKYPKERFYTTNMLVLYNNMLQSLYASQIQTIGFVFISIMFMFIILFRSFSLAVIAIIPNILPVILVLGFMGFKSIPLDLMTITIAAISVGIAVDNTIHYITRFKREFAINKNYLESVRISHESIGKAMYYTSLIVILGFSILGLSNFIPTIYFGLLTGLAMLAALVASLTLLPALILKFKPLGGNT